MGFSVLIAGGGKVGTYLGKLLISGGHHVTILENGKDDYDRLKQEFQDSHLIYGNPTNPRDLVTAGIKSADVVAAVTRLDETNLVIASLAKFEYRVKRTIARVNTPKNAWLFTGEMGVDVRINQADLMAHIIAREMSSHDMETLLKLHTGPYSLLEYIVAEDSFAAGKEIQDLHLPHECILSAIIRGENLIIPHGNVMLKPGDEVLAVIHESVINEVRQIIQATDL
jgi:trk system potassium uptake protein TrkA